MTEIRETKTHDLPFLQRFELGLYEGDTRVSEATIRFVQTRYGKEYVKTMTMSSVATPLEHRRRGHVKEVFAHAYKMAMEAEVAVSLMHPFSFTYYRNFGYGKVADHLIVRCPIRLIDFVPRCCELVKYTGTPEQLADLLTIYNTFSAGRQLMLRRFDGTYFAGKEIYIRYDEGKPVGYIAYKAEKTLKINHYEDGLLTVLELAYTTPAALTALLGFIRMFEGELDDVEFANLSVCPEVERALRHYTHTRYRLLPDISARIINTELLLSAHRYPKEEGAFRVRVEDTLPTVAGSFLVEYGGGDCRVRRLEDNAQVDMAAEACELVRLLYGYDAIGPREALYTPGLTVSGNVDDFFRAFPKAVGGMYEHF